MAAIMLSLRGLSRRVVQQIPQGSPDSLAKSRKDSRCHLRILLDQLPYEFADAGSADENRACDAVAFDDEQTMLVGALLRRTDDLLGVASWLGQPEPLHIDAVHLQTDERARRYVAGLPAQHGCDRGGGLRGTHCPQPANGARQLGRVADCEDFRIRRAQPLIDDDTAIDLEASRLGDRDIGLDA